MKEGTILIAKDLCKMNKTEVCALIIGKEYPVKDVFRNQIVVFSEIDENHYFDIDSIDNYFTIKKL